MRKRIENPIPFAERITYLRWLSLATGGHSSRYSGVIERAIYPLELTSDERGMGIALMLELEGILMGRYPADSAGVADLAVRDKILVQVRFALNAMNGILQ